MIGSFVLFVVLFAAASLGWGFVFSVDIVHLGRRLLILSIVFTIIVSIFSAVFFLKGLADAGIDFELLTSSVVFALTFVVGLAAGFGLSIYSEMSRIFSYAEGALKGAGKKEDRSEIIDEILDRTTQTGEINVLERELIESVLKFNDKIVREVMVPRGDVVAIDIEEEPHLFLRKVIEEGYSRLPAYRGSIDNIVGIIYAKDLLTMVENGAVIVLQDLLRQPCYVPEAKKISQLLREMQRDKVHLAVVVDEFGGTEGIITLEDVLEEIVGDIQDEYDENLPEVIRDENGDSHISGLMTVGRFNELMESAIPQGDDYDTMAGFVQKLAGKLPQKNEVYNHEEMLFSIDEVARHRIKRLKISFKEHPSHKNEAVPQHEIVPETRINYAPGSQTKSTPKGSRKKTGRVGSIAGKKTAKLKSASSSTGTKETRNKKP